MALVGLPGAGKSSVGPILAARLGRAFHDLDALVAREAGRGVPELLREAGEAAFRGLEREALRRALAWGRGADAPPSPGAPALVLACGGGVVTDPASRELLASRATVVWLRVSVETALARLGPAGVAERPLLAGSGRADTAGAAGEPLARLRALEASRDPLYESIAAVSVRTEARTPEEVAADVASALRERWDSSAS